MYRNTQDRIAYANAPVPAPNKKMLEWAESHPSAWEWVQSHADNNSFASSLMSSLRKWGSLTDRQLFAVQGAIARAEIAKTKAQNAPTVSLAPIEYAFDRAKQAGVTRPKLRLGEFTFSPAPEHGKNPNAIYIKHSNGEYLGKVAGGRLFTVASVSPELEGEILAVSADPLNSAIAYGKRYGKCSICARTLTDPDSIARGVGSVCADRFGW